MWSVGGLLGDQRGKLRPRASGKIRCVGAGRYCPTRADVDIVASAAGDPSLADRTWVLIHESPEGGWGIDGHAHTNSDIAAAARRELAGST
ncbi:MAG: hypothetical protein M3075_13215 [Candidatus Dormibacteraeota bacterium]|nr:hypothetical protein [Candidatus Dormibacteraeota bacterium]